jgi:hypothetical protein
MDTGLEFSFEAQVGIGAVGEAGKLEREDAACLEKLKKQNFDGHIFIEHENDGKDSVPQVKRNIDFIKAHAK